jgi:hypothetical protein
MTHLGLLNGRTPAESNAIVVSAFASADSDRDNALNLEEFTSYYHRATAPRLGDLLKAEHPEDMIALRQAFINWASFGTGKSGAGGSVIGKSSSTPGASSRVQLGSAHWLKICRDTGLVGRGALGSTDADLIFAKVKPRGLQKITFTHFVDALGAVANRLNKDLLVIVRQVTTSQGPVVNAAAVQTQQQRRQSAPDFAPRPSSLGHPHSRPGSAKEKLLLDSNNTTNNNNNNRVDSIHDGFKIPAYHSDTSQSANSKSSERCGRGARGSSHNDDENQDITSENGGENGLSSTIEAVLDVFGEFAGFGAGSGCTSVNRKNSDTFVGASTSTGRFSIGNTTTYTTITPKNNNNNSSSMPLDKPSPMNMEMDSKQFLKLCKDSNLATTPATFVAVDLCFAKAKARGARRLKFADFLVALALVAQEKKCAEAQVLAQVAACTGPRRNSTTTPEFTRLHDNKETYTGVYARGGPKTVDSGVPDLAKLLSREQGRRI